jgi:hypothetical protein
MMRASMMLGLIAAVAVLAGPAVGLRAHDGHDHKVMGTVTMAAADHVMLDDTARKPVTVQVTKDTRVLRDKKPIKAEQIPVGSRVVIVARMEKDRLIARTIDVGAVNSRR